MRVRHQEEQGLSLSDRLPALRLSHLSPNASARVRHFHAERTYRRRSSHQADGRLIGILWSTLTLGFEFLIGHFVFKNSWNKLLSESQLPRAAFGFSCRFSRLWSLVGFDINPQG